MKTKSITETLRLFAGGFVLLALLVSLMLLSGCAKADETASAGAAGVNTPSVSNAGQEAVASGTVLERPVREASIQPQQVNGASIAVSANEEEIADSDTFSITTASAPALTGYDPLNYTVTFAIANDGTADLSELAATLTSTLERTTPYFELTQPEDTELAAGGSPYYSTNFTVTPISGLAPGTYTDVVKVDYYDEIDAAAGEFTFEISFTVAAPIVNAAMPSISSQPQGVTVNVGGAANLLVAASVTDGGTLSYQWFSNQTNSNTGGTAVAAGGTSATFAAPTGTAGTFHYYVVVTNTNNTVNGTQTASVASNAATVVVNAVPVAPAITSANNTGVTFGVGGNFPVAATGTSPITFSLSGAPAGVTINNSTGLMTIVSTVPAGTYTFTITAGNGVSPNASQVFTLTVHRAPIVNAAIDVVAPVLGNSPVTAATIAIGSGQFTAGAVAWNPGAAAFASDTQYTATLTLTADANSTFTGGLTGTATINGNAATITNNIGTAVTLSFQFPATAPVPDNADAPTTGVIPADGGSVMVGFSQEGPVVTLDLNQNAIAEIINGAEGDTVSLDMTGLARANEAVKPTAALAQFAEAGLALEVSLPRGTVLFDPPALTSISEQAEYENVSLLLSQAGRSELTQVQRNALGFNDMVFSIRLSSGSQSIRNFDGTLTVTLPYNGPFPAAIWYLDGQGNLEKMDSTYDSEAMTVSFTTNHLSYYVAGQDPETVGIAPPANDVTQQANTGGNLALLIIIIGVAAGVTVFGIRKIRTGSI